MDDEGGVPPISRFSDLDATDDAERYFALLQHLERRPQVVEYQRRAFELLHVKAGDRVVEVGCGTGKAVADLALKGIEATGVDMSQQMVARARRRFPECDFRVAPAERLPFGGGELQGYQAQRVYQYLKDPAAALREARRVLESGGHVVIVDLETDLWAIDADDRELTQTLFDVFSGTIPNRWIGRQLRSLLLDAGFVDVAVEIQGSIFTSLEQIAPPLLAIAETAATAGAVTREQADGWIAEQRRRDADGRFFVATPHFLASARRP